MAKNKQATQGPKLPGVQLEMVVPAPEWILAKAYDNKRESAIVLPESVQSEMQLLVAVAVGEKTHVQVGDVLIQAPGAQILGLDRMVDNCCLIHKDAVLGVLRGFDYAKALQEARTEGPRLVLAGHAGDGTIRV